MEESAPAQPQLNQPQVSFPAPNETAGKQGITKWVIAIVGIVVIVIAGVLFIMQGRNGGEEATPSPTPQEGLSTFPTPEPEATPEPTSTPEPEPVDKAKIKVEVLNGTGTPGDAGLAKSELEDLGFEDILADNAEDQDETETTITYSRDLSPAIIDEIVESLEQIFNEVKTRKGTVAGDFDIRVLTGTKKAEEE